MVDVDSQIRSLIKQNSELLKKLQLVVEEKRTTARILTDMEQQVVALSKKLAGLITEDTEIRNEIKSIQEQVAEIERNQLILDNN